MFAPSVTTPLMRVSASGSAVAAVTALGPQQAGHTGPQFLPDGRRFLFRVFGAPETAGVYLGALDGSTPTRLTSGESTVYSGVYLPTGWLLWLRTGTLLAQRLDLEKAGLTGEPVTVADGVDAYSVSATGLVAYRSAGVTRRQLTWVDRSGTVRGTRRRSGWHSLRSPRVTGRPSHRRLPRGAGQSRSLAAGWRPYEPVHVRCGSGLTSRSGRPTARGLCFSRTGRVTATSIRKRASGAGVEEPLLVSDQFKAPDSWSADGRFMLYDNLDPQDRLGSLGHADDA